MRQLALPVRLRASSVFDSYFRGPNEAVVQQLLSALTGVRPSVIWLHGPVSSGKTHLLQAICARAGEQNQTCAYLPLREMAAQNAEVLIGCESLAFTCLDDFDAVASNAQWERGLFRLYTELEDQGGRLVIAAAQSPINLNITLRDLASRMAAGVILRLLPLTDEQQIEAMQLRAAQRGMELPTDTAQFLIRRLPRDMASLCTALDLLDEASLTHQRRLTVPFVREVLEDSDTTQQT